MSGELLFDSLKTKPVKNVIMVTRCEFTMDYCANSDLKIVHFGPCDNVLIDQDLVLNITCDDILAMNCDVYTTEHKLCASDGRTYENE